MRRRVTEYSKMHTGNGAGKLLAAYLLPLSLFALAASITYFTYEMARVSRQIPDIVASIDNTSDKIEPVVSEVAGIIELIPSVLNEVEETRKLIPLILKEVEQVRQQVSPVLKEFEQTRKQVPAVLKEMEAIRKELPAVLSSVDKASAAVVVASKEIKKTNQLIPDVLKEAETTRKFIPPVMDQADVLIEKARVAGKEASQGAVTGLFKGIITAPFVLIGDVGKSIAGISDEDAKGYSKRDFDLIEKASLTLLNNAAEGERKKWKNTSTGNHGTIELAEVYRDDLSDNECRTLNIKLFKPDDEMKEVIRSMCRNDDDQWDIDE